MKQPKPLVDKDFLLQKFPGKGGWTYAEIPEISPDKHSYFGWVSVSGNIDGYVLKKYKLMPMGNGRLFLPVKAAIRKKIGKEAGDYVRISLCRDDTPLEIPDELLECFQQELPHLLQNFKALRDNEQKAYLDRIYEAKTEDTKAQRILEMMDQLSYVRQQE